ncbi:class I SAM-dependent methyltransferase [Allokutzneria sp. A3M-2-11 16]|uniref:class I SAM-dependent methyltransferase n=1 Tax=Allokutzneria sp. A3M-2-11 16 TaxID=2962043 RepID=UPI0020B6E712|nr:class I SAM-dependent methyltransferase [Allokutzneria sp. A3M-2-11 16]MCP3804778.1 class I SAM-dependent methyltransferase [Allokutzneria sp. A3M-2-11 16]
MRVTEGFDKAAAAYDRLVGANPGYHAQLRLSARRMGIPARGRGQRLLDLGCGTGASTAALLRAAPEAEIVAVDGSAGMLARAKEKDWPPTVSFVHSRVEDLKIDGSFDGIFAAYLVRNLPDIDGGLRTIRKLLRPGAPFVAHEYSVADSVLAKAVWTAVCWTVIIPAGRLTSGDASLYRYLWRSVLDFDGVIDFENRLSSNGFDTIRTGSMSGWQRGVAHTFFARRTLR